MNNQESGNISQENSKEKCDNTLDLNSDWIKSALFDLRNNEQSWPLVGSAVTRWLSYYTLDPEQQILPNDRLSADERQEEIEKTRSEIETKLNSLSEAEKQILGKMHEIPGDPTRLTNLAIRLLAGLELAPFARVLVRASLSKSLNSDIYWPYEQFCRLLSFNSHDWVRARKALLNESSVFRTESSSSTGKWALVTILYSTGALLHENLVGRVGLFGLWFTLCW